MTTATIEAPPSSAFRVVAERAALADALDWCRGAVSARSPNAALMGVLIETMDAAVIVRATDLELSVRVECAQVQIEQAGKVLVNAEKLWDVVRQCSAESLALTMDASGLRVEWPGSRIRLNDMDAATFPGEPMLDDPATFTMPLATLRRMLNNVRAAIADKAERYAKSGILIESDGKQILMAATDSKRLHLDCQKIKVTKASAIIPAKAVARLLEIDAGDDAEISIALSPNRAGFECEGVTLCTSLLEGQFPPYEDIIPKDTDKKLTISRDELLSMLGTAGTMTTEESKGIRVNLSKTGLRISSRSEDGEAEISVTAKYEGADLEIGLNPLFLEDAIRNAGDEITIEFTEPSRPILVRDGTDYRAIVMPVNLQ